MGRPTSLALPSSNCNSVPVYRYDCEPTVGRDARPLRDARLSGGVRTSDNCTPVDSFSSRNDRVRRPLPPETKGFVDRRGDVRLPGFVGRLPRVSRRHGWVQGVVWTGGHPRPLRRAASHECEGTTSTWTGSRARSAAERCQRLGSFACRLEELPRSAGVVGGFGRVGVPCKRPCERRAGRRQVGGRLVARRCRGL